MTRRIGRPTIDHLMSKVKHKRRTRPRGRSERLNSIVKRRRAAQPSRHELERWTREGSGADRPANGPRP
jgi:hypothetical protein